jgi:hypothetical protein
MYMRCICGTSGREITKYTVMYGVYIYGSRLLKLFVSHVEPWSALACDV